MLRKITIENFQSHKKTIIELDKGVNAFIGDTDCGKSAIMRAINWVNKNRPLGESFVSDWADYCRVTIEIDEHVVIREKSKEFNGYIVDGKKFDGIGTGIPEQVTNILNLSDINIQSQFDNHFLITSSPGAVAEYLNTVVDLNIIDESIDKVNKELKKIKSDIKENANLIAKYGVALEDTRYVEELKSQIDSLKEQQEEIEQIENRHDAILTITEELDELNNISSEEKDYAEGLNSIENLKNEKELLDELIKKYDEIGTIIDDIDRIAALKEQKYNIEEGIFDKLDNLIKEDVELNNLIEKKDKIFTIDQEIESLELDLIQINKELKAIEAEMDEIKITICPLCGQDIKDCKEVV